MSRIYTVPGEYHEKTKKFMRNIVRVLEDNNVIEKHDLAALFLLGDSFNTYVLAREQLFKDGLFFDDESEPTLPGMELKGIKKAAKIKTHPALRIANDAHQQVTKLLIEFNLTPKSRKKPEPITPLTEEPGEVVKSPIDKFVIKRDDNKAM